MYNKAEQNYASLGRNRGSPVGWEIKKVVGKPPGTFPFYGNNNNSILLTGTAR
ncbi:hypothetical protein SAMN04488122_5529 [Chitinophaga arvensicola]|uniref:Uncharacterized protein n=1 Tax=Chitinophaga arvensicola TaxID=29529 RepID=A0A1I0SAH5_9BACT|nr:hypothetical protein SAMN04488122_5529 [Chitinophaga arvensicola]